MPRWLAYLAIVALLMTTLAGTLVVAPPHAAAASASAIIDTALRTAPAVEAAVLIVVPAGATLSLDGAPENDFYPVTYNTTAGWVAAADIAIAKDGDTTGAPVTTAAADQNDSASPSPVVDGKESSYVPEQESAPAAPTGEVAPAPISTTPPPSDKEAAFVAETTSETTPEPAAVATPPPPSDKEGAVVAETTGETTPAPAATPVPVTPAPTPVATGPATVTTDLNLRAAPDPGADVVFLVPAGSTVERTGQQVNGFVSATYMWMDGWLATDHLVEPAPVATEPTPSSPPADEVRTGRPGSGAAFATVELSLRQGPSANEPIIAIVPAGGRVVLTGVYENGYDRVAYREQVGWAWADYLNMPPDPEVGEGGDRGNRPPEQKSYTRDEIIKIIYAAADRYGQSRADMLRVAECESGLDPYAVNPSGSYGLFQFVRSTWKSTPYGDQDIFDPKANANAAAWMWSVGRKDEWVCK